MNSSNGFRVNLSKQATYFQVNEGDIYVEAIKYKSSSNFHFYFYLLLTTKH
jgi:hypothetical protein